jgi:hypothetical protein
MNVSAPPDHRVSVDRLGTYPCGRELARTVVWVEKGLTPVWQRSEQKGLGEHRSPTHASLDD